MEETIYKNRLLNNINGDDDHENIIDYEKS